MERLKRLLAWPAPAALTWLLAWCLAAALREAGAPAWACLILPTALGAVAALVPWVATTGWRRLFVAAGFPMAVTLQDAGGAVPAWLWLAPLALLMLAYPRRAWRDAPVFPTPRGALRELPRHVPLPDAARVLDAGCGMGDGLLELRAAYPHAHLEGIEWSALWRLVSAWRCPWAKVHRGDMWTQDWSRFDLVYLFQRPESMPRAMAKAEREMRPGSWLVSLEFEARDGDRTWRAQGRLELAGGRPVWLYRMGQPGARRS